MSTDTTTIIGPEDHGRTMTLEEFEHSEGRQGFLYELGRGVVVVNDVPNPTHFRVLQALRRQLSVYETSHPDETRYIATGSECKVLVEHLASERHPDLAIYKTEMPGNDPTVWSRWVPEILVEVVSPSSQSRDYDEKPDEYLQFGVQEYWVVDPDERKLVVLQRSRGTWERKTLVPPATHRTHLLPGFELLTEPVFDAAGQR